MKYQLLSQSFLRRFKANSGRKAFYSHSKKQRTIRTVTRLNNPPPCKIQEHLKIQADRQHIFAYMNDISNRTAYIPMLEEVILLEESPIKL